MKLAASLLLATLPALAAAEGAVPVPTYCDDFVLTIEALQFTWQNPLGGNTINIDGNDIRWGKAPKRTLPRSGMSTFPYPYLPLQLVPGNEFQIGTLQHVNFPILSNGGIDSVELVITMVTNIGGPFTFKYDLNVAETPNVKGTCNYPSTIDCADAVLIMNDPSPQEYVNIHGVKMEIDLLGFRDTPTSPTTTQFISQEGSANDAGLYGSLVLVDCPEIIIIDGDPHFKTWAGTWYDFQGACDLHMVNVPRFVGNMDLTIDVRTKIRYSYSYIESAVVQLGEETFQVSSFGLWAINGVEGADLSSKISGFHIKHTQPIPKVHVFEIEISDTEKITIKTFKDMVSVEVQDANKNRFGGSTGMMGDIHNGMVYSRDGQTILEDPSAIAREWQVRDDEPMLFTIVDGPQYPQVCEMPGVASVERHLGNVVTMDAAIEACAGWPKSTREGCVKDVLATGDLEFAAAGSI